MSVYTNLNDLFTATANAIREKTGSEEPIVADNFPTAIGEIETGGGQYETDIILTFNTNSLISAEFVNQTKIPAHIFQLNNTLTTVTSNGDVALTTVGEGAFNNNTALNCSLPNSIKTIESGAFQGASGLAITSLPSSLETIGMSAFKGCTSLALTSLPEGLKTLLTSCFEGDSSIVITKLPQSLERVGLCSFKDCTGITNIEIAAKSLGSGSSDCRQFSGCSNLSKVWIRESCETITTPTASKCVFFNCPTDLVIYVEADSAPSGWGQYWNRTGANGATEATVVYGQKTCPWA